MSRQVSVLYVEDDADDVNLAQTALRDVCKGDRFKMGAVQDGEEALKYLLRSAPYENADKPDMVLLDLNLPKIDGREVLRQMKAHEHLRKIPVVVLTTSSKEEDVGHTYGLGANAYVVKPKEWEHYQKTFEAICQFWFSSAAFSRDEQ